MELGDDVLGGESELAEHAVGRAQRAQDELRAAALGVLLDARGQHLDGAEGGAGADPRDDRIGAERGEGK